MIYSREVEEHVPSCTGCSPWRSSDSGRSKMGAGKGSKRYFRFYTWCRLVCTTAGCLQDCLLTLKRVSSRKLLVETIGCSGMTHSAAMAAEILPGLTVMEALNTDLVCDAINTAMRELFLQIVYGRSQSAFSEDGLASWCRTGRPW